MEQEDMEIDLINLLFYLLRKWRVFVLAMVCGAAILGGYKVASAMKVRLNGSEFKEMQQQYELDKIAYERTKTGYERDMQTLTDAIEAQNKYLQNSVLMKINPFAQWMARVDVLVTVPDANAGNENLTSDVTDSYVQLYAQGIKNRKDMEELSKALGMEENYLDELITVQSDYDSNTISISATGDTEDCANQILEELIKQVDEKKLEIESKVGAHSIEFLNRNTTKVMNQTLADQQKAKNDSITSYQNALTDKEKALHNLEEPSLPVEISRKEIMKNGMKFALIGALVGIFVVGGIYCGLYILRGRLHESDELCKIYGVNILGVFPKKLKKHGVFSGIDRLLLKLENGNERSDEEVALRSALGIERKIQTGDNILVTGTAEKTELEKVHKLLSDNLSQVNISTGEDMTKSVETVRQLKDGISKVILVEQREHSALKKIEEEITTIDEQGVEIIGAIVL